VSETPSPSPSSPPPSHPAAVTSSAPVEQVQRREWALALRNAVKMGGSLLITWSVALIVKLRVPAHLGPIRQGHFGFAESFAAMFFTVLSLGIDTHLMKEVAVRPKYASDVVGGVLLLRVLITLVLLPVMALVLVVTGRSGEILLAVMVFGLSNHLMAVNGTLGAVLQANSQVGPAVIANIATKIVWGVGLLLGLHFNVSLPLLALPVLVGEALRAAILVPATKALGGLEFRVDVKALREAVVESVPYFINGLALGILSSLVMSVLEFIRHDPREVGWFAAVQNLASLCMLLSPLLFWVVMPLLARAQARSEEEGMMVFRRCLEALVVAIAPITVLISAGSDFLIHVAFKDKYAPAATGLSILSLVFMLTYMNMTMATHLTILKKGWSVTVISISSVFVTSILMVILVPLGRHFLGEGGECAGAAGSVIGSESFVVVAMLTRYPKMPLDPRNIRVIAKTAALAVLTLVLNHELLFLGPIRLVVDAAAYAGLALAFGVLRFQDVAYVVRLIRRRGGDEAPPVPAAGAEG
jgi:O-antigen/teichoic acid export membrane protein